MQIGDVFICGRSPGHVVILLDVAKNNKNKLKNLLTVPKLYNSSVN